MGSGRWWGGSGRWWLVGPGCRLTPRAPGGGGAAPSDGEEAAGDGSVARGGRAAEHAQGRGGGVRGRGGGGQEAAGEGGGRRRVLANGSGLASRVERDGDRAQGITFVGRKVAHENYQQISWAVLQGPTES